MHTRILPLTTLVAALLIAGCGDNSATTPASAPPPKPATPAAPPSTAEIATALKAEADKLLADAAQYVKDNKWDLADKAVARLAEMKPQLPPEYGPRIDQLKQTLDAAKAAASKLPAGIKVP